MGGGDCKPGGLEPHPSNTWTAVGLTGPTRS